ncbi:ATP-binding protein [Gracilimonas sp.]|uniref:ATP-binding protein n=1 Tax=Gracilimonas sp. TaxID=1974203 RepID=UPI002870CAC2|nr:ATP-binding protein [Gracilimonas sp.]
MLDSIGVGFFTLDEDWNVTYWNKAAERLLHTPKHEIINQNLWDIFDDAVDLPSYTNYHRAMHERKPVSFEDYYEPIDKWFDINAYPSEEGISVFFKDITESKKAREALQQLNEELELRAQELATSNAELEQFAYVASHDLQESLRMVKSFLSQLDKKYSDKLDEKANQYINFAVDGAQRMRQIILDLLNYSRLSQEKSKRKEVDLNIILEDVKALERTHIDETGAKIKAGSLPTIFATPGSIKQVFQNLINNGLKYQESGTVPIIEIASSETDTHWKFEVKHNGIGIQNEFQSTVFQIFQRLHTRDQYSGTGIGLAISKKIIERHGGEIWLDSEEGKGSTFYFTISKE